MSNLCGHCGQKIKEAREHEMTGYLVGLLKIAAEHVIATGNNNFRKGDIAEALDQYGPAAYGNFPQLRYFGLIHHPTDKTTKTVLQRRWLVTRQGWEFLRGEWQCRKSVIVRDNKIIEALSTDKRIGIRDVGAQEMQTSFLYYDDDGNAVSRRPQTNAAAVVQGVLL